MENREVWQGRVDEWRASRLGPAEYCRGKSFTPSGLAYWVKKFAAESSSKGTKAPRIARVVRAAKDRIGRTSDPSRSAVTVAPIVTEVGSMRVLVSPTIEGQRLEALLAAVVRAATQGGAA